MLSLQKAFRRGSPASASSIGGQLLWCRPMFEGVALGKQSGPDFLLWKIVQECNATQIRWFQNHLSIIWTSFENHLNIIWKSIENHLNITLTSFENHLNIIWNIIPTSFESHLKVIYNIYDM
jgi:hypothetical protein